MLLCVAVLLGFDLKDAASIGIIGFCASGMADLR